MITKDNICVLIIWYNPQQLSAVDNILSYSANFKRVYIIDNSDENNSELASKIPDSVYISLQKNTGIAYALNRGFERAVSDGFEWVMTMDQDSVWDRIKMNEYLLWAEKITSANSSIVSLAPYPLIKRNSWTGVLFDIITSPFLRKKKDIEYVDRVICCANIVSVKVWMTVSGFNENLFIDEVDYEFCYRIKTKNPNFLIVQNSDIQFNHTVGGDTKRTIFPRKDYHSDFRLYYIFRNMMYIIKMYPEFAQKYKYKENLSSLIKWLCTFNKTHKKILDKAEKDCLNMIAKKNCNEELYDFHRTCRL